jgi:hypothetical protein
VAGDAYQLVLSSPSSSAYSIFPLRKGATHNFSAPSYFADGFAQYSADGSSWNNWPDENATPSAEGDLQFFFTVLTGIQVMPPTNVTAAVQ